MDTRPASRSLPRRGRPRGLLRVERDLVKKKPVRAYLVHLFFALACLIVGEALYVRADDLVAFCILLASGALLLAFAYYASAKRPRSGVMT